MATVTLAPVAARAAGTFSSAAKAIPAGQYDSITVSLTNASGGDFTNDTGFVQGDEIDGVIEISTDGVNWQEFVRATFLGGNPSPRTHGYSVSVLEVTIVANTVYRGTMVVKPGVQGAKITCGAQGTATLAQ